MYSMVINEVLIRFRGIRIWNRSSKGIQIFKLDFIYTYIYSILREIKRRNKKMEEIGIPRCD